MNLNFLSSLIFINIHSHCNYAFLTRYRFGFSGIKIIKNPISPWLFIFILCQTQLTSYFFKKKNLCIWPFLTLLKNYNKDWTNQDFPPFAEFWKLSADHADKCFVCSRTASIFNTKEIQVSAVFNTRTQTMCLASCLQYSHQPLEELWDHFRRCIWSQRAGPLESLLHHVSDGYTHMFY